METHTKRQTTFATVTDAIAEARRQVWTAQSAAVGISGDHRVRFDRRKIAEKVGRELYDVKQQLDAIHSLDRGMYR